MSEIIGIEFKFQIHYDTTFKFCSFICNRSENLYPHKIHCGEILWSQMVAMTIETAIAN